ncbi:hypothetical protein GJ496_001392 [Pomphorhynchus laevis]|nr:hypothetical protein GJ496_001392 [Pomphorhynchus laevis]
MLVHSPSLTDNLSGSVAVGVVANLIEYYCFSGMIVELYIFLVGSLLFDVVCAFVYIYTVLVIMSIWDVTMSHLTLISGTSWSSSATSGYSNTMVDVSEFRGLMEEVLISVVMTTRLFEAGKRVDCKLMGRKAEKHFANQCLSVFLKVI